MSDYRTVLAAVDLSDESGQVIARAKAAAGEAAVVHLVHVQEPMDSVYLGVVPFGPVFPGVDEAEERLRDELQKRFTALAREYAVDPAHTHYRRGAPAHEIRATASEIDADLIVIGTHGQKGVQLLLGSTANSVLHGVGRDVLAVRIHGEASD